MSASDRSASQPKDSSLPSEPASPPSGITPQRSEGWDIPLPPLPAPTKPAKPGEKSALPGIDVILAALVLALAFVLAANPVRNPDLLMQLATGRDLLQGTYNPFSGVDPYASTTEGVRWVNHNWLYGLTSFGIYKIGEGVGGESVGISALAVVKACLVLLLAFVLLRASRAGPTLWVPAISVLLASLTMAPRLLAQPIVLSYLFLGLTLWLLLRGGRWLHGQTDNAKKPITWKDYWLLLPLFALWVNLDEWFFLGPITVALFAAGQAIQGFTSKEGNRRGEVPALCVILAGAVFVCLLNPQHGYAFRLPLLLSSSESASFLRQDRVYREFFYSPLNSVFFQANAQTPVRLAYFVLLALGVLSFGLNYRQVRWWRVVIFVAFLLLSLSTHRLVPFFAVVAAPILALNLHDLATRLMASPSAEQAIVRGAGVGRALTFLVLLVLLGVAWPGWLQSKPYLRNRVSFANEIDPSFRQLGDWINQQRETDALTTSRGLNLSPETGNALAWYCPGYRCFLDSRFVLFDRVFADFTTVRRVLLLESDDGAAPPDWEALLTRYRVDHLLLYSSSPDRLLPTLTGFWTVLPDRPERTWETLYLDGHSVVMGWTRAKSDYRKLALDFQQRALSLAENNLAPAEGMPFLPSPRPFWELYYHRPPADALQSDEANLHLLRYLIDQQNAGRKDELIWRNAIAAANLVGPSLGGASAPPPALLPLLVNDTYYKPVLKALAGQEKDITQTDVFLREELLNQFRLRQPKPSIAPLLLAIRSARQALHANPEDVDAHLNLGRAYMFLLQQSAEADWGQGFEMLRQVRRIQAIASFNQALLLRPDLPEAHEGLVQLYRTQGQRDREGNLQGAYLDLLLQHSRAFARLSRQAGPLRGEKPEQFKERLERLEQELQLEQLEKAYQEASNKYQLRRQKLTKVTERAEAAYQLNLPGEALKTLLESNLAAFGDTGARMQLGLSLNLGRVREVNTWLDVSEEDLQALRAQLGGVDFGWYRTLLASAVGRYGAVDEILREMAADVNLTLSNPSISQLMRDVLKVQQVKPMPMVLALREASTITIATREIAFRFLDQGGLFSLMTPFQMGTNEQIMGLLIARQNALVTQAQYTALRGVLALEAGQTETAELLFKEALTVWQPDPKNHEVKGFNFPGRVLAEELLPLVQQNRAKKPNGL